MTYFLICAKLEVLISYKSFMSVPLVPEQLFPMHSFSANIIVYMQC